MNDRARRLRTVASALVREFRSENVTFLAGSLAYHAFVSLLPLLVLLLTVASLVGNRTVEQSIVVVAESFFSRGIGTRVVEELRLARRSASVSALGLAVLLWGTLRIFRGLDVAFSAIYDTEAENTVLDRFVDSTVVLVAFGLAVVAGGLVASEAPRPGAGPLGWTVGRAVAVVGVSVAFFPMYYVFPDTDVGVLEAVPGTVLAAAGIVALQSLFDVYLLVSGQSPGRNVVAGVVVLLTWLYFSGMAVLLGAVVNAVLGNRSRDVSIEPVVGGVAPDGNRLSTPRAETVESVERAAASLSDGSEVRLVVDGEAVSLQPPTRVLVDTDESLLSSEHGPVHLHLQWTPAVDG